MQERDWLRSRAGGRSQLVLRGSDGLADGDACFAEGQARGDRRSARLVLRAERRTPVSAAGVQGVRLPARDAATALAMRALRVSGFFASSIQRTHSVRCV